MWGGEGSGRAGCRRPTYPPTPRLSASPFQVEDLKSKNLLLRAQLRQHGVEVIIKDSH